MHYKLFGKSALRVSEICLGTMTFGEDWGWGAPKEECEEVFKHYTESGGNFIDTAINYTNGTSEKIVGELVTGDRDRFVLATKFTLTTRPDDPNAGGNHRKNLAQSLRKSLERLQTDYVDILWLHMWDYTTSIDEIMRSLDDLVRSGKVLHIGASDTPAWIVSMANGVAQSRGWTPFTGIQVPYSLVNRDAERELLPMARSLGLGVAAWAPLGAGLLTGKYTRNDKVERDERGRLTRPEWGTTERDRKIAKVVDEIAKQSGHSSASIALNWLRQQGGIVPVVGVRNESQLEEDLTCLDFQLKEDQLTKLTDASKIELGFPADFLKSESVRGFIFGKTSSLIDS